ncbi:MAG: lamin tail domain-containing protein [Candidatus Krumholzibacteriota bacterium]
MNNLSRKNTPLTAVILVGAILLLNQGGAALADTDDPLIINEVLADPASDWDGDGAVDFKNDEWIEVLNNGTAPIDLSDYYLRDILGEEPHLRLTGVVDPGEAAIFYGSDAVAWQTEMGLTTSGLSLNNGGDLIQLLREYQGPDGPAMELMFAISYDDHEAEDDRSCGFNQEVSDWILFDAMNPYGGALEPVGTGCSPSPGDPNQCRGPVAVEARSFGAVKAVFR